MARDTKRAVERIFLFHGDDDYTTSQTVRQWIAAFERKHSRSGVEVVDCEAEPERLPDALAQLDSSGTLFSVAQLLVIKQCFSLPADSHGAVIERVTEVPEGTFVLFWERTPVKRTLRLYKHIASLAESGAARVTSAAVPAGADFTRFMREYAGKRGCTLSPAAAERLAVSLGRDLGRRVKTASGYELKQVYTLWEAAHELDKLCAYRPGATISEADVSALVTPRVSENVFDLTDAVASGDHARAMRLLTDLLGGAAVSGSEQKTRAILIVGALGNSIRSLLAVRAELDAGTPAGAISQKLGLNPYRIQHLLPHAQRTTLFRLSGMVDALARIDRELKSSQLPAGTLLVRFVASASQTLNT